MVKELGKNSDNSVEISYKWFQFLSSFLPYYERLVKENQSRQQDRFEFGTKIDSRVEQYLPNTEELKRLEQARKIQKSLSKTTVPSDLFVRFMLDIFDHITNIVDLPTVINEVEKPMSMIDVFESAQVCHKLVLFCRRQQINWESMNDCIVEDILNMNEEFTPTYVG